jgi:hypothetical protein
MIWTPTKQIDQQEETKPTAQQNNALAGSFSSQREFHLQHRSEQEYKRTTRNLTFKQH